MPPQSKPASSFDAVDPDNRYRRRRSSSKTQTKKWTLILSVALIITLLAAGYLAIKALFQAREVERLTLALQKQRRELKQLRPQVLQQSEQIAELVQARLPTLKPLQLDRVIPIDQAYLKNIVFTQTGRQDLKRYEFKVTLYNPRLHSIRPEFEVLFFDHLGIQLKQARINTDSNGRPALLESDETKSFSASIQVSGQDEQPQYFKIKARNPSGQNWSQL